MIALLVSANCSNVFNFLKKQIKHIRNALMEKGLGIYFKESCAK